MSRILVAECKQEVSSFNPAPSRYEDFLVSRGPELFEYHRPLRDEVGGALSVFDDHSDLELIPAYGARAITSGGVLAADDWKRLSTEFLEAVQSAPRVDGVYFSLHGAMSAETEDDPEGRLLEETRRLLGEQVPLVISLDLHGILTDRMLAHSDAVVVYHTYPHVDFFETGARAARLLLRRMLEQAQPITARVKIPALVRGDELITQTGCFGECIRLAKQIEDSPQGLSAGMLIGNPFTDVPDLRTNSLVVIDGDKDAAIRLARELAEAFWANHEKMQVPDLTSVAVSVRRACELASSPETVVLMDAADATSSGASGDSNTILHALIDADYPGKALIPFVDRGAVVQAFDAGVGGVIRTTIGGAVDPHRFPPLEIEARVRLLSDGKFRSESFGHHWDSGETAVVQMGRHSLVIGSRPVSLYDRAFFYAHGQDPRRFDLVVVKSPHCEPHMFRDWCRELINVDAPGATSANLRRLGHTKCPRPIFPLDEQIPWAPEVEVFQR